jgi:malate/lactate dehydrogenase
MNKVEVTETSLRQTSKEAIEAFAIEAFTKRTLPDTEEIIKVLLAKNSDYGDAWQRFGIFTPLIRINDKILRVQTLSDGRTALVADETIIDTLTDIVGYGLLALLKLRQDVDKEIMSEETILQSLPDVDESDYEPTVEDQEQLSETIKPRIPGTRP